MVLGRMAWCALAGALLWAGGLSAQTATGTITGRVLDGVTMQPISGANITIEGTQRGTITRADGAFLLSGVPAGSHRVRASMIGYGSQTQDVTVAADGTATVQFSISPQAVALDEVVAIGYGQQRREAITGSVATINAEQANVGVQANANEMLQGRVAGVNVTLHTGEPGSGAQIRIRGGTSISASNDPLYVIDGVPIDNRPTEPRGREIPGTSAPLERSPLNLLNPNDIESITILKDASATAIYGSRGANGVVLITTKRGGQGGVAMEYDGYVAQSSPSNRLGFLNGEEYRQFRRSSNPNVVLGEANTDWERELTRSAVTHNHNLSFSGGDGATQYRASLNYMNQEGVVISNGLERVQGRLNAQHTTWADRLRLGLNLTSSQVNNDYLPFENTGGFEGGVFTNMAIFDPTRPVTIVDQASGATRFYETGTGALQVRNPVALARQVQDFGTSRRTLGNVSAALDLLPGVTAQVNVGIDRGNGVRRTYLPRESPVGAAWEGLALQVSRDNAATTLQSFVTLQPRLPGPHGFDVVGGYEFAEYATQEFGAEGRGFPTDAFGYHNLSAANDPQRPFSWREDSRLVSFFSRANYNFRERYYLTAVLRHDGSSRFGEGNKWATFPAISASWRISEEPFMHGGFFSDLRLRAGYGLQGNEGVTPYSSLLILRPGSNYVFGETPVIGIEPGQNPNPGLRWEQTAQYNVALDYGFLSNRFAGTVEFYTKTTKDLLLRVPVPQPAVQPDRLENIGSVRNRGLELSLDAVALSRPNLNWSAGVVFATERNEVVDIGGAIIETGSVSGEGQSGVNSQRIVAGHPIGTFWGREFVRVNEQGRQVFRCDRDAADCVDGETLTPTTADFRVIGNANPDFTLGLRSQIDYGHFDLSFLVRSEVGRDVFNNTELIYGKKTISGRNFLRSALDQPDLLEEPAVYSSRWIQDGSFVRLQNLTLGYRFQLPRSSGQLARVYVSGDNLLLLTGYSGYDPEVHTDAGLATRGIDYLNYPRPRTLTTGIRFSF